VFYNLLNKLERMSESDVLEWQVVDKIAETPSTHTFVFSTGKKFDFSIGQFVTVGTHLKLPTAEGLEESWVERAYSLASSPTRNLVELSIKSEKPYGFVNPTLKKADGFAAYFIEQIQIGDKVKVKLQQKKDHFLSKIAAGLEKDIAYWSGANGAESARCLIQFMEDKPEMGIKLTLFYSNPHLYISETDRTVNVIYYKWLIEQAKKMENLKVVFTFTKDAEILSSDHPRVVFRKGRFFVDSNDAPEKTLSKYTESIESIFNPICGSSGYINGIVQHPDGNLVRGKGIAQSLMEIEGVKPENIDKEQFYLDHAHTS
jgi:NAD(P)H-flavin reductase